MSFNQNKTITVNQAVKKLERYCAYQERCYVEVEQKLNQLQLIQDAKNYILEHLITENYINEERFARTYARGKFRIKKWGKTRIVNELKYRKISTFNIKEALKELPEEDYTATFNTLAEKQFKALAHLPKLKAKEKLFNYLKYRGWEPHLIYPKLDTLF